MGFWDAGTHMTKQQWAAACRRVENRLQTLKSALDDANRQTGPATMARKPGPRTPAARARLSGAGER
jgi:hypothetical protein